MNLPSNLAPWQLLLFYILTIWTIVWKGIALWRASKNDQKYWFMFLLIVNSFSVFDLLYLFRFSKKRMALNEIKIWFTQTFFSGKKKKKILE